MELYCTVSILLKIIYVYIYIRLIIKQGQVDGYL